MKKTKKHSGIRQSTRKGTERQNKTKKREDIKQNRKTKTHNHKTENKILKRQQ